VCPAAPYRRVLLKISGEAFCAPGEFGIDANALQAVAAELAPLREMQVQVGLVVGGGNFLRGKTLSQTPFMPRATADAIGMLATVMNALALQEALEHAAAPARVLSAVTTAGFCEQYDRRRAIRHLEAGRLVILAGGTGSPFFTTDTCAALRASELGADALLKATKVDGVFEADPVTNPKAKKFERLTYGEVLARQLGVMDLAAVSLCMESHIPVIVFRLAKSGNVAAAVRGEPVGTIISVS
jgi:uridylate kinase